MPVSEQKAGGVNSRKKTSNTQSSPMTKKYSDRKMPQEEVLSPAGVMPDRLDDWSYVAQLSFSLNLKCCLHIQVIRNANKLQQQELDMLLSQV